MRSKIRDYMLIAVCAVVLAGVLATATVVVLGAVGRHEQQSSEQAKHRAELLEDHRNAHRQALELPAEEAARAREVAAEESKHATEERQGQQELNKPTYTPAEEKTNQAESEAEAGNH